MSNLKETYINQTTKFPDPRHRILYDLLMDLTPKLQGMEEFKSLVLSILRYVKTQPREKAGINPIIIEKIKNLVWGSVLKTYMPFRYIYYTVSEPLPYLETLAELCYEIQEFDEETVVDSMKKDFAAYGLEDHKINLTTSFIAFSLAELAYETIAQLLKEKKWTLDYSMYFVANTGCMLKLVQAALYPVTEFFDYIDYDLNNLLTTEFDEENLISKLGNQVEAQVKLSFYCYSTKEILAVIDKLAEADSDQTGITHERYIETINRNCIARGLEKLYKDKSCKSPNTIVHFRKITKYEMLTTYESPIVDEAALLKWQKDMVKLEGQIRDLEEFEKRPWALARIKH